MGVGQEEAGTPLFSNWRITQHPDTARTPKRNRLQGPTTTAARQRRNWAMSRSSQAPHRGVTGRCAALHNWHSAVYTRAGPHSVTRDDVMHVGHGAAPLRLPSLLRS